MNGEKVRKKKKYIVLGCALLLLLALLAGYLIFGISRPNRYTAYSPLTGRVFRLKSEEIEKISITRSGYGRENATYNTPEEIRILAEYFNGFRCSARFPKIPEERSGGSYLFIHYKDGETAVLGIGSHGILIENNWYLSDAEYFSVLYYGTVDGAIQS